MAEPVVDDMTREWWLMLPQKYREMDAVQDPPYPLLRWMAGVGGLLDQVRQVMEEVGAGEVMDPQTTRAPRWLAQILGIDIAGMSAEDARAAMVLRGVGAAAMIGTRDHVGRVAASVLGHDAQIAAVPDPVEPFIIYVLTDELSVTNAGGLEVVRERMRQLKSVPAGHVVMPVVVQPSWDEFDAAKGQTWAEFGQMVRSWAQHDAVGVDLSDRL